MSDLRPLGWSRAALGVLFVIRTTALANLLPIPLAHVNGPLLGWPAPGFRFAWLGLVLPDAAVIALAVVRTLAGSLFSVGILSRPAGIVACVSAFAVLSQDPFGAYYTLLVLFGGVGILALVDSGARFALRPAREVSPASGVALVRFFVASIYAWSAVAKLHRSWLDGGVLRALVEDGHLHGPLASLLSVSPTTLLFAAWAIPIVELALGPALLWPRTRRVAFFVAVGLHATFEAVARPDVIGWAMLALLISFLPLTPRAGAGSPARRSSGRSRWRTRRLRPRRSS